MDQPLDESRSRNDNEPFLTEARDLPSLGGRLTEKTDASMGKAVDQATEQASQAMDKPGKVWKTPEKKPRTRSIR